MRTQREKWLVLWSFAVVLSLDFSALFAAQQPTENEIARYSRQAEQAMAEKNLEAAVAALEKLAQLTPEVAEVHSNLGMVYYMQGRFGPALAALDKALKVNPKISNADLLRGICLAELGRHREALPILEAVYRNPPSKDIARLIGLELERAYTGLHQYGKAAVVAEDLVARYPNDPEILYHTSRLHADRALKTMARLVQTAPNSVWVRQAFAEVHESQKRYDLAIAEYRNALKMDPRLPGIHFRLGRAILLSSKEEKSTDEAMHEFEQELALDPQNSNAEYEIGEIYRRRGQVEQAREHFSKAVRYHPEFEDARIALARTLINLKRPQEALPHLLEAVRLEPANEVSHFLLASVYKALGDSPNHQKEMALFQKYHIRPYASESGTGLQAPPEVVTTEVTKQTLDSEGPPQP